MIICCVCLLVWAGWLTDWVAEWLTDPLTKLTIKPTYWLTEWMTKWLMDWLNDWWTDCLTVALIDWPNDWLNGRMTDWLNDLWLTYWLNHWLNKWQNEWLFDWLTHGVSDWVSDWLTDWMTEWLSDWQEWLSTDWMIAWLIQWLTRRNEWYTEGVCIFSCLSSLFLQNLGRRQSTNHWRLFWPWSLAQWFNFSTHSYCRLLASRLDTSTKSFVISHLRPIFKHFFNVGTWRFATVSMRNCLQGFMGNKDEHLNPVTPIGDQKRISPYSIKTKSGRQVTGVKKIMLVDHKLIWYQILQIHITRIV